MPDVDVLSPESENGTGDTRYWGAQIAGQAVVEIADLEKSSDSTRPKITRVRTHLLDIMEGNRLPAVERAQAGSNLAALGDPRFDGSNLFLPGESLLGFIRIPQGRFRMGSDPKMDERADENEQPQHKLDLPYDYYLARYPVTVAQYRLFVEQSGYKTTGPESMRGTPNHPVVSVTWYDALEYSKWLNEELKRLSAQRVKEVQEKDQLPFWKGLANGKLHVTLPSEAEWEKAARGGDGRIYPWGNEFDADKANVSDTGINATSAVGCFPSGSSPYGVLDMSGNVWEWTRSLWKEYPYLLDNTLEDLGAVRDKLRVYRAGSFFFEWWNVRCAFRLSLNPDGRGDDIGFRIAVSPILF